MTPDIEKPSRVVPLPPSLPQPDEVDYEAIVIEDDEPVDSVFTEKQHRLLTHTLYASWDGGGEPFFALSNVGLFSSPREPPVCPDVMVSRRVRAADDLHIRANRSYFLWVVGKAPEAVIEIISDRTGGEEGHKMVRYSTMGIPHYILFDPEDILDKGVLRAFRLVGEDYEPADPAWLEELGLGLRLWHGTFETHNNTWLRWCDRNGVVIPTGEERAEKEHELAEKERELAEKERERAEKERERAEKERELAEKERKRADKENKRAERERERADKENKRAERERERADKENKRAEKERERAEKERERAEKERERAELEQQAKEEAERKAAELQQQLERLAEQLRAQGVQLPPEPPPSTPS